MQFEVRFTYLISLLCSLSLFSYFSSMNVSFYAGNSVTLCVCVCFELVESMCIIYVVRFNLTLYIKFFSFKILVIVVFPQWYLFFLGGIDNFTPTPQRSKRGRKRGRERESALKDWSLTNSLETLMWLWLGFSECMFLGNLRNEIWKSLYFRLHYTLQHCMDILSVCGHFWMQELMWPSKMWDEREMENRECEWVNKEKRGRDCETDREVCIRRGMDDWYLNFFWDVKLSDVLICL